MLPIRHPADYADRELFLDQIAEDYLRAVDGGHPLAREDVVRMYPGIEAELGSFSTHRRSWPPRSAMRATAHRLPFTPWASSESTSFSRSSPTGAWASSTRRGIVV